MVWLAHCKLHTAYTVQIIIIILIIERELKCISLFLAHTEFRNVSFILATHWLSHRPTIWFIVHKLFLITYDVLALVFVTFMLEVFLWFIYFIPVYHPSLKFQSHLLLAAFIDDEFWCCCWCCVLLCLISKLHWQYELYENGVHMSFRTPNMQTKIIIISDMQNAIQLQVNGNHTTHRLISHMYMETVWIVRLHRWRKTCINYLVHWLPYSLTYIVLYWKLIINIMVGTFWFLFVLVALLPCSGMEKNY